MNASILVTGGGGMLARAIGTVFGDEVHLAPRAELDIRDASAVHDAIRSYRAVINTAAYTAVDDAESHEDEARVLNADAVEILARECKATDIPLVHLSTDYVFQGTAGNPYRESDTPHPRSAYGRSKREGEDRARAVYPDGVRIVRTAWLYGAGGKSFVRTMVDRARAGEPVSVVTDQIGQPTWTVDLAHRIQHVVSAPAGIYHGTNSGSGSWWDLAVAVYECVGADPNLVSPTDSTHFIRAAERPAYSVLADDAAHAAGIPAMRNWRDALAEAIRTDFSD